jgi:hypothetical protein
MMYAYAQWTVKGTELPEDLQQIHISNGAGDEQYDAFDLNRQESRLTITGFIDGYDIELVVWSDGLEKEKDYWLSPSELGGVEAHDFGIKELP